MKETTYNMDQLIKVMLFESEVDLHWSFIPKRRNIFIKVIKEHWLYRPFISSKMHSSKHKVPNIKPYQFIKDQKVFTKAKVKFEFTNDFTLTRHFSSFEDAKKAYDEVIENQMLNKMSSTGELPDGSSLLNCRGKRP